MDNNTIMSPKTFMNKKLFDSVSNIRKGKKVLSSEFKMLKLEDYEKVITYQYNVSQLKEICIFHKIRKTGNKDELIYNIYNYLKYSLYAIKVQRITKGYILRKYLKYGGPGLMNRKLCINETDFATLDPIKDIPYNQFYSFTDSKNNTYGCDIISLYGLVSNAKTIVSSHGRTVVNPYNREIMSEEKINNFSLYLKLAKIAKIEFEIQNVVDIIEPKKQMEMKIIELFQYINELGNYADSSWLTELPRHMLVLFIRELYDIWNYRAQLLPSMMREITPPHGNPFIGLQLHLAQNQSSEALLKNAVRIIEIMVKSGITVENRSLGAYYVLAALTLVNDNARNSLPWLYQSVAYS